MKYKFLTLLVLVLCVGCGKNVPLRGKVLDKEGNPITRGMVNFVSDKGLSRGEIQSDGSYVIGTHKSNDGLLPGTYKVYVTGAFIPVPSQKPAIVDSMGQTIPPMPDLQHLIAAEYTTEARTPLTCEVPVKGNRYDVIVEKP